MNKPYLYYYQSKDVAGVIQSYHENDGLKGKVAPFTRALEAGKIYAKQWCCKIIPNGKVTDYASYSYIVSAIGLVPADTLTVAGVASSKLSYDRHTTATPTQGVFVVGVGYPPLAQDGSKNIGISKFWPDIGKAVAHWQAKPAKITAFGEAQKFYSLAVTQSHVRNSEPLFLVARL